MKFTTLSRISSSEKTSLLQEHISSVLTSYPKAFHEDLLLYGQAFAERVLDKQDFAAFDPMVSDRSCQLRAIWLACFARLKIYTAQLNQEDLLIFGLARFLCESAIPAEHPIIGSVPLKTRSAFWPEGLFRLPNAIVRRRFFGQAKSLIAERILCDMEAWLKEIPPQNLVVGLLSPLSPPLLQKAYKELVTMFRKPVYSIYSEVEIPVVPFLPGFIAVTTLAAQFQIPLVLIFRKICQNKLGQLVCAKTSLNGFLYDETTNRFNEIPPPIRASKASSKPVVVFSGHSYLGNQQHAIGTSVLQAINQSSKKSLSIIDYIYAIMATHTAMPGERRKNDWKIARAPVLSNLTREYLHLAHEVNLSVHETVRAVFNATQPHAKGPLVIDETSYEVVHVCNASWKQLKTQIKGNMHCR